MNKVKRVFFKGEVCNVLYHSATSAYIELNGSAIWVESKDLVFHI